MKTARSAEKPKPMMTVDFYVNSWVSRLSSFLDLDSLRMSMMKASSLPAIYRVAGPFCFCHLCTWGLHSASTPMNLWPFKSSI